MKGSGILELVKNLVSKAQGLTRTQMIIAAVTGTVAIGGVGTGGYLIYSHNQAEKPTIAEEVVDTEIQEAGTEAVIEANTEMIVAEIMEVTEETEETESVEDKALSLVGTSMEKDLKIKIQNQKSKLVTGEIFEVSVKQDKKGASAATYQDKDKDGIIYIDKLDAGNYKVDLKEIEGYEIKKGSITVAVKDELEYKKVDVEAEVKKESEINASVEDTAQNNIPVESTLTDTVPLLPSEVKTSTVEKSAVDQSNFTAASASSDKNAVTLTKETASSGGTGDGGSTEKPPTETQKPTEQPPTETQKPTEQPPTPPTETQKPTEQPPTPPTETQKPTEQPPTETTPPQGSESVDSTQQVSVERYSTARTATAAGKAVTAKVSLPKQITLYNCENPASTAYQLSLGIEGDSSIIKSVAWSTTNPDVVALSAPSGNTITISKGANSGTRSANVGATITYVADEKGTTKTVVLQTTVTVSNLKDTNTVLKDKSGNTLYKDEKAQKQATLGDYNTSSKFYTSPQYTGWQTIDGKVYYYNQDHKPVTGNQVIGGVMYTFAADGSLAQSSGVRGIDVSKWQGNIDWGAVASSGITFAIIRVGYRGASTGVLVEDPYFRQNIAGATRAGIKVGVYFFTQAVNEAEAVEEASMALSLVSGYNLSLPIFIDTENASNGRANGLDAGTRTAVVRAFCQTVANSGRRAGIYASKNWYETKLHTSQLSNYTIWVAQYNSKCTYSGKYDLWQYTSKGSVPGIKGNVDMNISYM